MDLPTYEVARLESSEFTDLAPTEYRADAVVVLTAGVKPVLAVVTDVDEAGRVPELAVLSAMAHGADPDRSKVLDALLGALAAVDEERANLYCDVVLAALPAAARGYLEALVTTRTYEYQSDFARRYFFQGRAEGEAKAVLAVLDARGIGVPTDVRTRITECSDIEQLDSWVRRAATANSIQDLFE